MLQFSYLNVFQSRAHVMNSHIITNNRRVQAVRGQQLRPPEPLSSHPGRASLEAQDLARQSAPPESVLALPAGPGRLLLVRRRRLVYGVNVERVAEMRVWVGGLGVGDGLVRRWKVRGLEV